MTREQNNELVFPEDPSTLDDAALQALYEQAVEAFDALYDDGHPDEEALAQMRILADGIDMLREEINARAEAAAERADQAAEIRNRVRPQDESEEQGEQGDEEHDDDEEEPEEPGSAEDEPEPPTPPEGEHQEHQEVEPVAASGRQRRPLRVNLSGLSARRSTQNLPATNPTSAQDIVLAAPDVPGFTNGQHLDWMDMGRAIDARLTTFQRNQYELAAQRHRHLRQQFGTLVIQKAIPEDLWVRDESPWTADEVFAHATDETRLPGGSLVASGGWCAPSETVYDLLEMESRDGLLSLPEVGISRGGIRFNKGPDFAALFRDFPGFHYTEEQIANGQFGVDENGVGTGAEGDPNAKPCIMVPCPDDWEECRLDVDGICISAGLLMARGYPEALARILRGALVAHAHRVAGRRVQLMVDGSDAVDMTDQMPGVLAPTLTAIELQVEHYRYVHRLTRATSLEAIFPFWVRGAVRSDLSLRLGVDFLSVTDAQIDAWFRSRGINPQFIYNFQDIAGDPGDFTAWPGQVSFLLYAAGTWMGGTAPIITVDTLYDSMLLGQNNFTALFTEEGYLVCKRGWDSRFVTVPICPDGATGAGVAIECGASGRVTGPGTTEPTQVTATTTSTGQQQPQQQPAPA